MPRGGARRGAGAKLGSKQKRTLEKAEANRLFRAAVQEHWEPLFAAQMKAAVGGNVQALKDVWDRYLGPPKETQVLESKVKVSGSVKVVHEHHPA